MVRPAISACVICGSMRIHFSDSYSLSRCSSSLKISCPKVRVVSNTASPMMNPRSLMEIEAWLSGTISPFTYATRSCVIPASAPAGVFDSRYVDV